MSNREPSQIGDSTTHRDASVSTPPLAVSEPENAKSIYQTSQHDLQDGRQLRSGDSNLSKDSQGAKLVWNPFNIHEWQPEQWCPSAIVPNMFYQGSSALFPHWIDGGKVGFPALLLNWDLFRSLLRNAHVTREHQAAHALREKKRKQITALQQKLWDEIMFREARLVARRDRHWRPPRNEYQRRLEVYEADNEVDENDAVYNKLSSELADLDAKCQKLQDQAEHAHDELMPLLDDLFGKLGALPDFVNPEAGIRVPVFEKWHKEGEVALDWPENTWNDVESAYTASPPHLWRERRGEIDWSGGEGYSWLCEDPEDTWNNHWEDYPQENPVFLAEFKVDQALRAYTQVQTEFDQFRDHYDGDLYWYIAKQHKFRMYRDNEAEIAELEQLFDAEWFVKFRSITRRLERAEKDYKDAEKERLEAERLFGDNFDKTADQVNAQLVSIPCEADVQAFGKILSSSQVKRIDTWLALIPFKDDLELTPSVEDSEASVGNISPNKRKREDDGHDGASHSKRQRQVQGSEVDEIVAMLDVPEQFGYVSVWELAIGYQRQQIDDYAQQARQAWEDTKARL